ncbi:MAG: glycosyltransferase family 2 protein, partial [Microbacterium sp.]|nr:glycosyltransferase family 2 protein [Microbacterium sp.]
AIGEILVVDDSSSDDTAMVALKAALEITPNARVLRASCRDAGGARNLALAEASCPWIYLIDADDLHLPGGLSAMLKKARAGADLVVGGSLRRVDGEDRKVKFSSGLGRDAISNAMMYLKGQVSSIAVAGPCGASTVRMRRVTVRSCRSAGGLSSRGDAARDSAATTAGSMASAVRR